MHFTPADFEKASFTAGDVLEYGSVALKTEEARLTHEYLINKAVAAGALICFDPNIRFNLWDSKQALKDAVTQFAGYADIIKVGDDELEFITGKRGEQAVKAMFTGKLKLLLVTYGGAGAKAYLSDGSVYGCGGYKVKTVDTTGAGDSFFGSFIAQLMEVGATADNLLSGKADFGKILDFACKCGAYTTAGFGAIPAMGNKEQVEKAVK